jgi:hypothetical protein
MSQFVRMNLCAGALSPPVASQALLPPQTFAALAKILEVSDF